MEIMQPKRVMSTLEVLQKAIREDPRDTVAWAALNDYLQETGTRLPWKWKAWTEHLCCYWRINLYQARKNGHIRWMSNEETVSTAEAISVESNVWFEVHPYGGVAESWVKVCPQLHLVHIRDKKPTNALATVGVYPKAEWSWLIDPDDKAKQERHYDNKCFIPKEIIEYMGPVSDRGWRTYATSREAKRALSAACIKWARKKAGLE